MLYFEKLTTKVLNKLKTEKLICHDNDIADMLLTRHDNGTQKISTPVMTATQKISTPAMTATQN